jgi:hypothetical protein
VATAIPAGRNPDDPSVFGEQLYKAVHNTSVPSSTDHPFYLRNILQACFACLAASKTPVDVIHIKGGESFIFEAAR